MIKTDSISNRTTLNIIRALFLLITLAAFTSWMLWNNAPDLIANLNEELSSLNNKYESLQDSIRKSSDSPKDKIKKYKELFMDLKEANRWDEVYYYKGMVMMDLINLYLEEDSLQEAYAIAEDWYKEDDYDIDAKLYYGKVISKFPEKKNLATNYYKNLSEKYYSVDRIKEEHISYLIQNDRRKEANDLLSQLSGQESINESNEDYKYKMYFADSTNVFTPLDIILPLPSSIKNQQNAEISFSRYFKDLRRLRLDIEGHQRSFMISNITIMITHDHNKHEYPMSNYGYINNLIKVADNQYVSSGIDPYFELQLPPDLSHYRGTLTIKFSFSIEPYYKK